MSVKVVEDAELDAAKLAIVVWCGQNNVGKALTIREVESLAMLVCLERQKAVEGE